jgi:hypothetical protein
LKGGNYTVLKRVYAYSFKLNYSPKNTLSSQKCINRIQAIASILKQEKGVLLYGGVSPSKIGLKELY